MTPLEIIADLLRNKGVSRYVPVTEEEEDEWMYWTQFSPSVVTQFGFGLERDDHRLAV